MEKSNEGIETVELGGQPPQYFKTVLRTQGLLSIHFHGLPDRVIGGHQSVHSIVLHVA